MIIFRDQRFNTTKRPATLRKATVQITPLRQLEVTRLDTGDVVVALVSGDGTTTMRVSSLHLPVAKVPLLRDALTVIARPPRAGRPARAPRRPSPSRKLRRQRRQ